MDKCVSRSDFDLDLRFGQDGEVYVNRLLKRVLHSSSSLKFQSISIHLESR
jgi:hypothetical protein